MADRNRETGAFSPGPEKCPHGIGMYLYCCDCAAQARDLVVGRASLEGPTQHEVKMERLVEGPALTATDVLMRRGEERIGDYAARKQRPLCTGLLDYFPDALLEVAYCSYIANEQHNPGEKLHWAKEKSIGEGNEILRHMIDRGKKDTDGIRHMAKAAWRALELLQREIEADRSKGIF
jgi:hypothetical protein